MFTMRDHFSNASQANVEAHLALNTALADKLLDGARRLADLNKSVSQASLLDFERALKEIIAVQNPQELCLRLPCRRYCRGHRVAGSRAGRRICRVEQS
jgi:hypothetical protein